MVKKRLNVKWDGLALGQLREACNYIKRDSVKSALKVKNEMFEVAGSLGINPERHPLDKYKINNDGS